jgi:hypothetical protein
LDRFIAQRQHHAVANPWNLRVRQTFSADNWWTGRTLTNVGPLAFGLRARVAFVNG